MHTASDWAECQLIRERVAEDMLRLGERWEDMC